MVTTCPDTGATQTVINENVARQANLAIDPPGTKISTASGGGMKVVGESDICLQYKHHKHFTTALICSDLKFTILVAWHDLVPLHVISESFPACLCAIHYEPIQEEIVNMYPEVFRDALSEEPMNVPPVHIYLTENAVPYRISTPRQVPLRFQNEADATILKLLKAGVIIRVDGPEPWCAPAFFVPKGDGISVRMVTDFTHINRFVIRPVHPFPSVQDIVQCIPAGTAFFAKMDAIHGYFQLALDEDSSRLTTFLLPSGRYRYLRAPMGLSSSSDEWCRHSDTVLEGLPYARKIVDDILVWAETMPQLVDRVKIIAERCKKINIVLSRKKFEIGSEIAFAGLMISARGIKPDPERIKALTKFPAPRDISGVRSFLGLANQLSGFVPDFAHMTVRLRELTSKKNAFFWGEDHQKEFEQVKDLLTSDMVVTHFNPNLPVTVLTDASRLHGLGFAMGHYVDGRFKLVTCGSKALTPTQQRYATIELECLAVHFAVTKCSFYLKGLPHFTVATDHKPLEGVFKKDLFEVNNPRLQRIREKLLPYTFTLKWVAGKSHHIADALSRAPLFQPADLDDMLIDTARTCLVTVEGKREELTAVLDSMDADYVSLKNDVLEGTSNSRYSTQLKAVFDHLSVDGELVYLDAKRIIVPLKGVKPILKLLHISHVGVNKTYDLARSLYYWPGMLNDIKQLIEGCEACSKSRPSQPKNIRSTDPPSSTLGPPMSHVGLDMFEFGGHQHIVCVDQWSGYPLYQRMSSTTAASVIRVISGWFNTLGWPTVIRTDGGPQFRSEFTKFCESSGIKHELASPYNPRANGLAESGVKIVKDLLLKCMGENDDMQRVLYEWRNMPKSHGYSPAQLLFGRSQNMLLPQPAAAFLPIDFSEAAAARDQLFDSQAGRYNRDKVNLDQLSPGQLVRVQNENTGLWDITGTVCEVRPDGLSYLIDIEGRSFVRGRPKLKPVFKDKVGVSASTGESCSQGVSLVQELPDTTDVLRRSVRLKEKEKCIGSLSSSACGLSSDTNMQHLPWSYSVPCPPLVQPAEEKLIKKNWKSSGKWPNFIETIPRRTQLISQTQASPSLISSGPVLPEGHLPLESSPLLSGPSLSAVSGRPRQGGDDERIRNGSSRQLAQSAPQQLSQPPPLPGPLQMWQQPFQLPSPVLTGLERPPVGPAYPHHTLLDPVGFQGFRSPNSRLCSMTGISTGADTLHAVKPLKCEPSRQSLTTREPPMAPCPVSQSCGTRRTGDPSLPGPPVVVHQGERSLQPVDHLRPGRQVPPRLRHQVTQGEETTRLGSSPPPISESVKVLPRESIQTFNNCKSSAPGNVHSMKIRF